MSEEKLEFTRPFLIWANLALLAWLFVAFLGMWFYNELYGWLLLAFTASAIYMILRRLGCSSCYNCKTCTNGFGRLAGAFFGIGYVKKDSLGNRIALVAFIYFLLAPLPTILLILSTIQTLSVSKVAVLVSLQTISIYSASTWRRNSQTKAKPTKYSLLA